MIDEDGCSLDLLDFCLKEYQISYEFIRFNQGFTPDQVYFSVKAMICHNGDHFFSLVNYERFWIDFNSLAEEGPEILMNQELSELIYKKKDDGYSFFNLSGNFPRMHENIQRLKGHQRLFSINEIVDMSVMRKVKRNSQHEEVQKKIQENY